VTASWIVFGGYALVVVAAFVRSRAYGIFAAIVLAFPTLVGNALREELAPLQWVVTYAQLATLGHFGALLVRPALRPIWFRALVSIPGLWFAAACLLGFPWAIWAASGGEPVLTWLPFLLATLGLVESLVTRRERVDIVLDGRATQGLARATSSVTRASIGRATAPSRGDRPLRIVQITDPHLGPFMSIARLREICQRAVDQDPDLIVITGDLMTMESHDARVVTEALAPLAAARGKVFACHGNHDHEARAVVAKAYATHGITLLVDDAVRVTTPGGVVQIIGADFVWRGRAEHLARLAERFPRESGEPGPLRLWLLHDPGAFKHMPAGEADLVLSGHTHGGQVGLVSLGLQGTFLSAVSSMPDHGLWGRGTDRLYVHRANGHYGFPIRLGVPAEESVLYVWRGSARV
jgi:hypothetical protein